MKHFKLSLPIISFLGFTLFFACTSPTEKSPLRSPELRTPVTTGIIITDIFGNEIGRWGNPDYRGSDENDLQFVFPPYPNPTTGDTEIICIIRSPKSLVDVWVVPATLTGQENSNAMYSQMGNFFAPGGLAIKELVRREEKDIGYHSLRWNGRDSNGNEVPSGFYRIYTRVDGSLFWYDILVAKNLSELPPGMNLGF